MSLIYNERTKLLANALDRLSTASVAAGFIAPVSSFAGNMGFQLSVAAIFSTAAWLVGALILQFGGTASACRPDRMTSSAFFFLYLLPFVLAGGGWIAVLLNERHNRHRSNLHPGE